MHLFNLKNKNVIITGAGRGLGLVLSNYFQRNGSQVIAFDKEFNLKDISSDINKIYCDFEDIKKTTLKINNLLKKQQIDVLINCAAITVENEDNFYTSLKNWDKVLNVNLKTAFIFCKLVGAQMIKNKIKGKIINFSSIGATRGFPNNFSYGVSKSGLAQLTRVLANDWGKYSINVNTIVPGYFKTPMNKKSWENLKKRNERSRKTFIGRWAEPKESIGPVVFLSCEASSYVTGSEIVVDGGWLAKGL